MKQKLKRFMAGFMAMLTLVGTLFTNGTTAFAASPQANIAFWNASVKNSGEVSELKPGYNHGKILYSILDGNSAYCMNFGLRADGGQLMNSYDDTSTSMSAQQRKFLSYCLYYGFNSTQKAAPSNSQCDEYIATQAMVWVIVADIFGTGSGDSAARKLCNTAPSPDSSYSYYERLREFTAKLRVIKKDSDTKQTVLVPNAEFKIFNLDKNEYVTQYTTYPSKVKHTSFFTDEDGDLILPEALKIGNYRIEEIKAPFGYVVNDKYVNISVDTDTAFETDGDTNDTKVVFAGMDVTNERQKVQITVTKTDSETKEALEGAVFGLFAKEDIVNKDGKVIVKADGRSYKYYFVMVICSFVRGNVMYILSKLISKKGMQIADFPREILGVLVMVFTFTVLNCCFVILLSLEAGSEKSLLMCASIVISIVLTDYFMLYMMERFNYLVQKQYEDAMYREEMHYKDIYYEEAEKQNKEVQKLKHDMKHKLHELYHLVENSDGQELSEKIGAMCMEFEQIDEKQYSDNPIVDSVLRIKFGRAKARGIKVETSIRIPKQMQLDHGDIGVLYGNLVDNAVEACSKVPEGQRFVKIENKYQSGILLLIITNSKTGKKNKSLKTTKKDNIRHGHGVQSVRKVVEKYNGTVSFTDKGDIFEVSAMLYGIEVKE